MNIISIALFTGGQNRFLADQSWGWIPFWVPRAHRSTKKCSLKPSRHKLTWRIAQLVPSHTTHGAWRYKETPELGGWLWAPEIDSLPGFVCLFFCLGGTTKFRSFHPVFSCFDLGYGPAGRLWQGSLPGWNMFYGGRFGARILLAALQPIWGCHHNQP